MVNTQRTIQQTVVYKTLHRNRRTPDKIGGELRCFRRVRSSFSSCATRRMTLVANPVICHEWRKDRIINTTN
jgi:hypothetical protein